MLFVEGLFIFREVKYTVCIKKNATQLSRLLFETEWNLRENFFDAFKTSCYYHFYHNKFIDIQLIFSGKKSVAKKNGVFEMGPNCTYMWYVLHHKYHYVLPHFELTKHDENKNKPILERGMINLVDQMQKFPK